MSRAACTCWHRPFGSCAGSRSFAAYSNTPSAWIISKGYKPQSQHSVSRRRGRALVHALATSQDYNNLKGQTVLRAVDGTQVELLSLWQATPGTRVVIPFLTHFADLSSWEFAQKLIKKGIPQLQQQGVQVFTVGLGTPENARLFARELNYPLEHLYADPSGACYKALGFNPGFAADVDINPYLKLLPMLMGIGSPGTVQEVLRGYVGDRGSKPVFDGSTPFDILGNGYQRPFELATLRLNNMIGVLSKWGSLSPPDTNLLVQQGGTLAFDGQDLIFKHEDSGILKYTDVEQLVMAIASATPISSSRLLAS
eukprot:jgi/Chrzof1/6453/Cz18g11140.t1